MWQNGDTCVTTNNFMLLKYSTTIEIQILTWCKVHLNASSKSQDQPVRNFNQNEYSIRATYTEQVQMSTSLNKIYSCCVLFIKVKDKTKTWFLLIVAAANTLEFLILLRLCTIWLFAIYKLAPSYEDVQTCNIKPHIIWNVNIVLRKA